MLLPASTGSGESDLVSARFAEVLTAAASIAVLSLHDALPISEVVLAVLEMLAVREESTFTTRVTDLLAPEVIVVERKRTRLNSSDANMAYAAKLVQAGIASDRLAPVASDGPLLVTVSV